ncbi:MAG TPA: hypothetical protein VGM05_32260 [Planctomycetaceae bacterium]
MTSRDPRACVILAPFSGFIHLECENALKELERGGYPVRRVPGYAAIDPARNPMASDALRDGFEETLWIDSDVGFDPESVERLRSHDLPIVCGIYPKKGQRAIASNVLPKSPSITFGEHGGLMELLYAGAGFLHVRREVHVKVQQQCQLPVCNECFGHAPSGVVRSQATSRQRRIRRTKSKIDKRTTGLPVTRREAGVREKRFQAELGNAISEALLPVGCDNRDVA